MAVARGGADRISAFDVSFPLGRRRCVGPSTTGRVRAGPRARGFVAAGRARLQQDASRREKVGR